MESLDYWRLCDEVSVIQAALLIVGEDPSGGNNHVEGWNPESQPIGYQAAKTAIFNAINSGDLEATIRRDSIMGHVEESDTEKWLGSKGKFAYKIDTTLTTIKVQNLRAWLSKRGFTTGFFFPQNDGNRPDYLDKQHPNYSPKLAAAIEAWLAVTESPEKMRGKTAKQAIMIWLRSHAERYGLIKEDGNPNENGIEEVAKVANWNTKGGAPETPVS